VVSTIKDPAYEGYKLMIVAFLNEKGEEEGRREIAFDCADAGVGDTVLVLCDGGGTNIALEDRNIVSDIAICGVIDYLDIRGERRFG
jgi:microcompartment protein CcmK/EutM